MEGKIVSTIGGVFTIYADHVTYNVFSKGILRFQNKNLLVGDNVLFSETSLMIEECQERKNSLKRPRAANVDQIVIIMSVSEPSLSPYLLYKFLTYANSLNIPSSVIFTKTDICNEMNDVLSLKNDLEKIGVPTIIHNKGDGVTSELNELFAKKVSLLMGQTGAGKSSLINSLDDKFAREIGDYSIALGRGKHQTKEVILLPYKNGFIGDTPGFSSLELDIFKEDLAKLFPGFNDATKCYYSNCLHVSEKNCAIKEELNQKIIPMRAYDIYLKMLEELPCKKEKYR